MKNSPTWSITSANHAIKSDNFFLFGGRFKYVKILAIFVHGGWSLAVFFGILLVVGLILYYLDKNKDLVGLFYGLFC